MNKTMLTERFSSMSRLFWEEQFIGEDAGDDRAKLRKSRLGFQCQNAMFVENIWPQQASCAKKRYILRNWISEILKDISLICGLKKRQFLKLKFWDSKKVFWINFFIESIRACANFASQIVCKHFSYFGERETRLDAEDLFWFPSFEIVVADQKSPKVSHCAVELRWI